MKNTLDLEVECSCGSIGRTDLRQCKRCFHIWNGDVRLTSVGHIVSLMPQPPCNSCGAQSYRDHAAGCPVYEKILNAQDRGKQVDELFSEYVIGGLHRIPAGTRQDVWDWKAPYDGLLQKLCRWFDKQNFKKAESQVVVGDGKVGGVLDLKFDGVPHELKSVYDVTPQHVLQCAGYVDLEQSGVGFVIHVTERYPEPRLTLVDLKDVWDFRALRAAYDVITRRSRTERAK